MKWILAITGWISLSLSQTVSASEQNGWVVNERLLHPNCFTIRWMSSDNFEEYEERFQIEDIDRFRKFPGEFFGREITEYAPLQPSWSDQERISLIQSVNSCAPLTFSYTAENGQIYTKQETEYGQFEQAYKLLEQVSVDACDRLAPSIGTQCIAAYRIEVGEYSGGSMGWDVRVGTYGLFDVPRLGVVVVPLQYL